MEINNIISQLGRSDESLASKTDIDSTNELDKSFSSENSTSSNLVDKLKDQVKLSKALDLQIMNEMKENERNLQSKASHDLSDNLKVIKI